MTTQAQQVPFGEWLPDLPQHDNPGALEARNVIPQLQSYREFLDLQPFSTALAAPAVGSFWAPDAANNIFNFAGDQFNLYNLTSGITWSNINGPSAPYDAENWEFAKFGETILAVNGNDPMQKYEMNVDATFLDQPGTPPNSNRIAIVRDFVMIGDIPSQGPNFVRWSAYNNSEDWVPRLATQSDFQELFGRGGRVQKIVPGEYAVIFLEQSIYRADYVGPPVVFQFDEVERKRGTPAPNSVCWSGGHIWYYGWDGFYHFDGQRSEQISHNRVSRWFELNADAGVLADMRGVVDRRNRLVIWAFKSSGSAAQNDRLLIYNWAADKWAYAFVDTQVLDEYVPPGFTLDELDGPLPAGIDIDSIPVDSDAFQGGFLNLQAFNSSNESATFSGTPLDAIIDTKEISMPGHNRFVTNSVRPLVEATGASTITLQTACRNALQENPIFEPARSLNGVNGEFSIRKNARYQRYRLNISGGFDHGKGVKASIKRGGRG